jgi:hypothetical protein
MSEKTKKITADDIKMSVQSVLTIEDEECFVCGEPIKAKAHSLEGLIKKLKRKGYKKLDSDYFGAVGYWCGCEYDTDESDFLTRSEAVRKIK